MQPREPQFATTQWTLVWRAAQEDSQHGRPALAEVIRRYWKPLYSYARKRGFSPQDAEDATQEFLSRVMSGRLLDDADPAKGKFRAFLLTAWQRFLIDEFRRQSAQKRGHNHAHVPLDVEAGERAWTHLESREPDAERVFMRSWASSLLEEARNRLRDEYGRRGKSELCEALLPKLTAMVDAADYAQLASQLGSKPGAIKVALHRMRQRFGTALRALVLETVDDAREVDMEIEALLRVLRDSKH